MEAPRGLDAELEGYAWIPRMLDKARATLAGTAGPYLFGCPVDHTCMARLGIAPELVLDLVAPTPTTALCWMSFVRTESHRPPRHGSTARRSRTSYRTPGTTCACAPRGAPRSRGRPRVRRRRTRRRGKRRAHRRRSRRRAGAAPHPVEEVVVVQRARRPSSWARSRRASYARARLSGSPPASRTAGPSRATTGCARSPCTAPPRSSPPRRNTPRHHPENPRSLSETTGAVCKEPGR